MLKLSPRMQMAADMVRPHTVVCDVGTDHAYLPSFLILNGKCEKALACDIGVGPLENARKSVELFGLQNCISLRLSDGLDNVKPKEADDFVFCGMGGTLIASLLKKAPWLRDGAKNIIVQPMTHGEDVRLFFIQNGFEIKEEKTCEDSGHVYVCMKAVYTGCNKEYSVGFPYHGLLLCDPTPTNLLFVRKQEERLCKKRDALCRREESKEEYERLCAVIEDIHTQLQANI